MVVHEAHLPRPAPAPEVLEFYQDEHDREGADAMGLIHVTLQELTAEGWQRGEDARSAAAVD